MFSSLKKTVSLVVCMALIIYPIGSFAWLVDREDKALNDYINKNKGNGEDGDVKSSEDAIRDKIAATKQKLRKELAPKWNDPLYSDQSRWVSYSKDKDVQRVVDFKENEVSLTLPRYQKDGRINFAAVRDKASDQMTELLSTTVADALAEDPLHEIWDEFNDQEGNSDDALALLDELVFSELFDSSKPSSRTIERVAQELMDSSYISYDKPVVASSNESRFSAPNTISVPIEVDKISLRVPLPSDRLMKKAKQYLPFVAKYSREHNVPPHVVFAVIHTESHFNPLARSSVPAYGLMQVVPSTAGMDVAKFLFKRKKQLSSKFLFNPENNIRVGTTYLRVVYYHYLKKIDDPNSRLYLTIASYNAGTSNVARAFVRRASMRDAVSVINKMSSEEVLEKLLESLPAKETRDYLRRVLERAPHYSQFDELAIAA